MKEIIVTYILSYIIIIISAGIYTLLGYNDLTFFINNCCIYIVIIYYILTSIYLYKKNKITENKILIKLYYPLISLGISIAIIYNMIIFKINPPTTTSTLPLFINIISSGVVGPIFEEILFRYVFYNRLKNKYSIKKSIIINSLIFAIIHISPIKIIYAFILGITLNITYENYTNIKAPILIHISANVIAIFLTEYNLIVLLLSIVNLIISIKIMKEQS